MHRTQFLVIFFITLGCIINAVAKPDGETKEVKGGGRGVRIHKKGMRIAYYRDGKDQEDKRIVIAMIKAEEEDANGKAIKVGNKKHDFKDFGKKDFKAEGPVEVTHQGARCTNINFTAVLDDVGAELTVPIYIVKEDFEFVSGDESFSVAKGALKFNIKLKSWKFCGDAGEVCQMEGKNVVGERVCFYIDMKQGDNDKDGKPKKKGKSKGNRKDKKRAEVYELGDESTLTLLEAAEVDGKTKTLDPLPKITTFDGKTMFKICLPKFKTDVFYDPVAQTSGAVATLLSVSVLTFALFTSVCSAIF